MNRTTTIDSTVADPLAQMLEVLGRTGDAMVAMDGSMEIIAWNDAATELLGYSAEEVLGRPCSEVLCWRDRCGDSVCGPTCPASELGDPDEIMGPREVLGRSSKNQTLWLSASTIIPPVEMREECRIVHLIREIALPPELERLIVERLDGWSVGTEVRDDRLDVLTPREREVLQLLTEGLDGTAIAEKLYVSPATVRNHIQHILTKLNVHSRVEAVAFALRRN
ncbi:MAG: LuxR C-terminal-related transcriptional regulator [Acidimicrobiia bacterium]|nr:LuxR C-terminal-related transcriptional regulator [Acidimicrobiia bacterium]